MKFDHITMDVSQTPPPFLLPVWCSIRCSNSLSNSIVNAISACESAVGSDGLDRDARPVTTEPYGLSGCRHEPRATLYDPSSGSEHDRGRRDGRGHAVPPCDGSDGRVHGVRGRAAAGGPHGAHARP